MWREHLFRIRLCPLQAVVKLLLAHGAVVSASAADNMNALHFAAMKGQADCLAALLAGGMWLFPSSKLQARLGL